MPSDRFEAVFRDAASIVERRCRGMSGVSIVLDDIRRRGQSTGTRSNAQSGPYFEPGSTHNN